jgi:hypothetical protein
MKGQLVFEFVVAALFFLAIIIYTINYLNSTVFLYTSDYYENSLESKAWQISEILVRNEGIWAGSNENQMTPSVIGLAENWPVLNESKINSLNWYCSNFKDDTMWLLNIDPNNHGAVLEINKSISGTDIPMLVCGDLPRGIQNAKLSRFGISEDGNLLKVRVWYW